MRLGFRHCDPRFPFLWISSAQPAARWHASGEGPANYFADTPLGAWAEFLRHEEIRDENDLAGVRRSLWAVHLPDEGYSQPQLPQKALRGDTDSYPRCQREARRLRESGAACIEAPSAALKPGAGRGWVASGTVGESEEALDGRVWVLFGPQRLTGWPAVEAGSPPPRVLARVNHFGRGSGTLRRSDTLRGPGTT